MISRFLKHALLFTAILGVAAFTGCAASSADPKPAPTVLSFAYEGLTPSGVTLTATVNPNGEAGYAWFEWSETPDFSTHTDTARVALPASSTGQPVTAEVTGLAQGVTYYFRAAAGNSDGGVRTTCDYFSPEPVDNFSLVVNSSDDPEVYVPGKLSLREALSRLAHGGTVTFDPRLNGATINLTRVGEAHSLLKGEVFSFAAGKFTFQGYQERDYGKSAFYLTRDFTLDASALPSGVTLRWQPENGEKARIFAVLGNMTLNNLTLSGGNPEAEALPDNPQAFTLARGGAAAVWGIATFRNCTIAENSVTGDTTPSRDRGAFGGGVYADTITLENCVVGGNRAKGFGAAGGGLYSVGGVETAVDTQVTFSSVSGNRVTGQHAYGGGVYSDGGGPGNYMYLIVESSTIAGNRVEDHPDLTESPAFQYYYRGGGIYMSNGTLHLKSATLTGNEVEGVPALFKAKPNMGGGAIAATIGDAHVVEEMTIGHSIITGNTLNGQPSDLFSGSLVNFYSDGYNLAGHVDFGFMLAPIPWWTSLCRVHWPKVGDEYNVEAAAVLDLDNPALHPTVKSAGANEGAPIPLYFQPKGAALDIIPETPYTLLDVYADYWLIDGGPDDFLNNLLDIVREEYAVQLGPDFGLSFGDLTGTTFYGPAETWPSATENAPWVAFWTGFKTEVAGRLGPVDLTEEFWGGFQSGPMSLHIDLSIYKWDRGEILPLALDQRGYAKEEGTLFDVGAIEKN